TVTGFGQAVSGIDAALPPGATIGGKVTGPNGSNPTGICVLAIGGANPQGIAESIRGHYRVMNLLPGQYLMVFVPGCGNRQQSKAEENLVGAYFGSQLNPALVSAPVGDTFGINGTLVTGGNISGKIRSKTGKSVDIACVALTGLSGAAIADSGEGLAIGG